MGVWQSTHPRVVYHLKFCQNRCGSKMVEISIPSCNDQYKRKKNQNVVLKSSCQVWTKFHSRTVPAGANVRQPCSFTLSSLTQPAEHLLSKINPTNYALILEAPISDCSSGYPVYCSGEQRRLQMEMYCHVRDRFSLQDPQGSSTCTLRLVIDYGQAFIIFASLFCM